MAPGTHAHGFMNGRWQVSEGSPGYFTPVYGLGVGLGACSCVRVPDPRLHFNAERENAEPGPRPKGSSPGKGDPRTTFAAGNRPSAWLGTTVSSIWDVVLRNGTFKVSLGRKSRSA